MKLPCEDCSPNKALFYPESPSPPPAAVTLAATGVSFAAATVSQRG